MSDVKQDNKNNEPKSKILSTSGQGVIDVLVKQGVITLDQVRIAQIESSKRAEKGDTTGIIEILTEMGFLSESVVYDILSTSSNQNDEKIDIKKITPEDYLLAKIPKEFAIKFKVVPITETDTNVKIATNDPYNIVILDQIGEFFSGKEVVAVPYSESQMIEAVDKFYKTSYSQNIEEIIEELEVNVHNITSNSDATQESSPAVRLVNALLYDAIRIGASDIHIEPDEFFVRVRLRIDGVMINKVMVHKNHWSSICVRVKVLSGMNIAESRKPQDGAINMIIQGRPIDFRVSLIPTIHGENIVIRILDRTHGIISLEDLGFNKFNLGLLKLALQKPEGIVIITGPTGSGKTTTLYSVLAMINSIDQNIMTLEEPVEYRLPIIRQSEINHRAGFDFGSGLRSLLRQDPDIIFLGEIRDQETAQTALRASATGHQVFSTLHTNSAISAITRLVDIGIQPFMLSNSLVAVVAQRLVRKLCPHCKVETAMSEKMKQVFELPMERDYPIFEAKGCNKCFNLGYKGRIVISEVLFIDDELNLIISSDPTIKTITEVARKNGFVPIQRDGILKIVQGITSWDEVSRVIDMTNYIKKLTAE